MACSVDSPGRPAFLKGNGGGMDLGEVMGRTGKSGNSSQDEMHNRRTIPLRSLVFTHLLYHAGSV